MAGLPRINVSISHSNTSQLLRTTLASIKAQSYLNYSIVIYDACSSDGFSEVVHDFHSIIDYCISEPDSGFYDGLSKAFAIKRGEGVYCYINAGDVFMPYAFEAVAEVFASHPVDWLTSIHAFRDYKLRLRSTLLPLPYVNPFVSNGLHDGLALPCLQQESTFWSYSLHEKIDLRHLSTFSYAGDGFIWRSFARHSRLWVYNRILSSFTIHGGHLSANRASYRAELRKISAAYILLFLPACLYSALGRFFRIPTFLYKKLPFVID